jgi:hypothetical protein
MMNSKCYNELLKRSNLIAYRFTFMQIDDLF